MHLREMNCEYRRWVKLDQDRVRWGLRY